MWAPACGLDPESGAREGKLMHQVRAVDEEENSAWEKLVEIRKLVEK